MGFPSFASEFPNDNSEISAGAIWIGSELTGPASLELAVHETVESEPFVLVFEDEDASCVDGPVDIDVAPDGVSPVVAVAELRSTAAPAHEPEAVVEAPATAESDAGFAHFEATLIAALMSRGATRAAASLPLLLRLEPLPADAFGKDVQLTLQSRGYLEGACRYSPRFRDVCAAWSAVLRGATQDFGACGTTTLDRFGAELLAALLAVPATRADELRRDLRKAGIAAFGVLQAA